MQDLVYSTPNVFKTTDDPIAIVFYGRFGAMVARDLLAGQWVRLMQSGETLIVRPNCSVTVMLPVMAPIPMVDLPLSAVDVPCIFKEEIRRPATTLPHYIVVNCVPDKGVIEAAAVPCWSLPKPPRHTKFIIPAPTMPHCSLRHRNPCSQRGCRGRGLLPCSTCKAPTCDSCAMVPDDNGPELSITCPECQMSD